jgi:PAS domain S-box-containing protein
MAGHAGRVGVPFEVDDEGSPLRQCRDLLDAVGDGLYQLDAEGRIVAVDASLAELIGHAREDLFGRPAAEFLREGDVSTAESTVRAMLENDLETAYHAGFFEWPRDSSGEELADALGIAPATFTQHLRTAERKLLDALFEELPTGE